MVFWQARTPPGQAAPVVGYASVTPHNRTRPMSDSPASPKVSRRLAAILAADIAGYSALMGVDDVRTVHDLKGHPTTILPMIAEHGGRGIGASGGGVVAA